MGQTALTPSPHFKAVLVLALCNRAFSRVSTSPGLSQVWAICPSVYWCGQDMSSPVLQTSTTSFAANWPRGKIWNHTVLRAGNQAHLLHGWFLGKELTNPWADCASVRSADTVNVALLNAMLRRNTLGCLLLELVGKKRDKNTSSPIRKLPFKEILVPVTDLKALPFALWLVHVLAVRVVGCPALHVNTPYCPRLNPTRTTLLPDTLTPLAWKKEDTQRGHFHYTHTHTKKRTTWAVKRKKKQWFKLQLFGSLQSSPIQGHSLNPYDCFIHELRKRWTKKQKIIKLVPDVNIENTRSVSVSQGLDSFDQYLGLLTLNGACSSSNIVTDARHLLKEIWTHQTYLITKKITYKLG